MKYKDLGKTLSKEEMKNVKGGGVVPICGRTNDLCNITYHNADCCSGYFCGPPFNQLGYEHIGLCQQ